MTKVLSAFVFCAAIMPPSFSKAQATGHDVCKTKYTNMHYAESLCFDVQTKVSANEPSKFSLRTVLVTNDLKGIPNRKTIVLIPGGPGESAEPLKTELQKREIINAMWRHLDLNVVIYDPRGTGLSKMPRPTLEYDNRAISVQAMVEDLRAVIQTVRPGEKVILFAHSSGGHVAFAFAEKYPEYVDRMILVSVSESPRSFARLNQALLAKRFWIWEEFIANIPESAERQTAINDFNHVSDVLEQQLKARILKKFDHEFLNGFSPRILREELLLRIESDPSGTTAFKWLSSLNAKFREFESIAGTLTPDALRSLKLTSNDLQPMRYGTKEWIQRLILCGEGTLESELDLPLYYDGITMRRFCDDLSVSTAGLSGQVSDVKLEKITAPILLLSGKQDAVVPPLIARKNAARLKNSKLIVEDGAGHLFFDKKALVLYNAIESFLRD